MVEQLAERIFTPDEYLDMEECSREKHEYFNGEIFAMASASDPHDTLASNILIALGTQLRGSGCSVKTSGMRLLSEKSGLYTYSDGSVVCGKRLIDDRNNLKNPKLVVEVFSQSTERYDRGSKFLHYKSIPTFTDYLLVSQFEHEVTHQFIDSTGEWDERIYTDLNQEIPITSLGITLSMSEIYQDVELAKRKRRPRVSSNGSGG